MMRNFRFKFPLSNFRSGVVISNSRKLLSSNISNANIASSITFSSGTIGHLATGNSLCTMGKTMVHTAICVLDVSPPSASSLPLTVEMKLRAYATGEIPPNINRRERHGSDEEVLMSRVIDRSIRPLFPKGYLKEIQLTSTIHSIDHGNQDPIVCAVNAASYALLHSQIKWNGPIGCVRIGYVDKSLVVNPSTVEMERSELNLLYAGTYENALMIEAEAHQVNELMMNNAFQLAQRQVQSIIEMQLKSIEQQIGSSNCGDSNSKPDVVAQLPSHLMEVAMNVGYQIAVEFFHLGEPERKKRSQIEGQMRTTIQELVASLPEFSSPETKGMINEAVDSVLKKAFCDVVLIAKKRPDGRSSEEVRPVTCKASVLPDSVHGSAFFTRGDTHVLCSTTLGPRRLGKPLKEDLMQYFFLHYDFPPFSTGTLGSGTSLNRRMIGHGTLAERALRPLLPNFEDFPYTVRVFSECTSSSGSSSMASVCGGSLALLDTGVPIKASAAGVSIGLVTAMADDGKSIDRYALLTDIIGTEDHFGEMDFKVAGTETGLTAIQLDVKLPTGVPLDILQQALVKAKAARVHILAQMNLCLSHPRSSARQSAPSAEIIKYDPDRKRFLLGPGGETVRYIEDTFQCDIDTSIRGIAYIYGKNKRRVQQVRDLVQDLVIVVKEGDIVSAEVIDVKDFGAMVKITRAQEALLHVSEISHDKQLIRKQVDELLAVGQRLTVQVTAVDKGTGLIKVSRKRLLSPAHQDFLEAQAPQSDEKYSDDEVADSLGFEVPPFPTSPPKAWSIEYFRHSIASEDDVSDAMARSQGSVDNIGRWGVKASGGVNVETSKGAKVETGGGVTVGTSGRMTLGDSGGITVDTSGVVNADTSEVMIIDSTEGINVDTSGEVRMDPSERANMNTSAGVSLDSTGGRTVDTSGQASNDISEEKSDEERAWELVEAAWRRDRGN